MGIVWLNEITKEDIALAGGKGANLGELIRNEIPVPNGFVIDSRSFIEFLEITGLEYQIIDMLRGLDVENTQKLQETSKMIRELIESTEIPEHIKKEIREAYRKMCEEEGEEVFVAVRSSATAEDLPEASFAGQQETYLNVKGEDAVIEKVKKCWSSLYTPRAIYYRVQKGFRHEDVSLAVVIQKMVNSEKSGVMFTSHPVTGEKLCVIEAVFGLGEAIVSGKISPDTYIYDRINKKLVEVKVSEKNIMITRNEKGETVEVELPPEKAKQRVLTDEEIKELVKFAEIIENLYNHPQDVEWAIEKGKVYIVQSRPITTIKEEKKEEEKVKKELKILLKGLGASPGIGIGKVKVIFSEKEINKVEKGDILVTTMTTPDMVPAMKRAAAIVTDEGGLTCHAAIVSRELGVPAVVGTKKATKVLKDGMIVTVDGEKGIIYEGALEIEEKEEVRKEAAIPVFADVITATEVKVNISIPEAAERAAATGADGVGLFRIEHMVLGLEKHPMKFIRDGEIDYYIQKLYEGMKKVVEAFYPKPVWIRTLDAPTDEFRALEGGEDEPIEANPMLGFRGIRRDLMEEIHFRAELRAIKKLVDEGFTNIGIMLPMVSRVDEVRKARKIIEEEGLWGKVEFGIMVETPASALIIEDLVKEGIDFISFGTNDLTQYTLAVDRNNENVAYLYDETHPAVMKLIEHVIKVCKKHGVKTSICGQAGSYPHVVEKLVKMGIDSVSANPDAVRRIREVIARVEKKIMLEKLRELQCFK
uniref:Phosphoenolpyruvate synthase n=1 Tax=Geoglobus ahangari TaxID=113653 RepID=A0A7C3YFD9_9EURY